MRIVSTASLLAALSLSLSLTLPTRIEAQPKTKTMTGDEVAERIEARDRGDDGRLQLEMRLYDHRGRETVRRLTVLTRRRDGLDSLILRFDYPGDIRDTGLLSLEHAEGDDDRFLFLPALGRSRRISAQEKQDSFVGSDFTYEEITGRHLRDYAYEVLGESSMDGRPVYLLESTSKDEGARYPRAVSRVDAERFIILHSELYDESGSVVKVYSAERIERIDGIWTAREQTMRSLEDGTRSVLEVLEASYDRGIPATVFSRTTLERGGDLP